MGKPKGKNAFFYYLMHTQQVLKREGKHFGLNDNRLQEIAGNKWKDMTPEERKPFEDKSKAEKEKISQNIVEIQPKTYAERAQETNYSRILSEECHEMNDSKGRDEYLDDMIKSCVKACQSKEDLIKASFFIIGSNIMVETGSKQYLPLEISIVQYNIKDGIQFTYHKFIDAGPIPLGYARLAKEWCNSTHKIPLQNFCEASNDYQRIVEEIIQILENSRFTNEVNNKPTPMLVFCLENAIKQNRGVLEWLANKYRSVVPSFEWNLEVLDLVSLLYHITNQVNNRIVPAVGEDKLTSSAFDYSLNTNCSFHDEQENRNCAQGLARRLCYMLSTTLCPIFEITPTENHLPPNRENVVAEIYSPVFHDFKPLPNNRLNSAQSWASNSDWVPTQPSQNPQSSNSNRDTNRPNSRPFETGKYMSIGRGRGAPNQKR